MKVKHSKIIFCYEKFTPERAAKDLKNGVPNRPIRNEDVEKFKRDMIANKWRRNGETIKYDKYGRMFDGQNRLRALIKANATLWLETAKGYEPESIETVDSGRARCPADVLSINKIKYGHMLCEAIKRIYGYQENIITRSSARCRVKLSNEFYLQFVKDNPLIKKIVSDPLIYKSKYLTNDRLIVAMWFIFSTKNKKQAAEFMENLIVGTNLKKGDPVLVLRNLLLDRKMSSDKQKFLSTGDTYGLFLKAWNLWRSGEKVDRISIKKNEPFQRVK